MRGLAVISTLTEVGRAVEDGRSNGA
jgi:hypothetical protein